MNEIQQKISKTLTSLGLQQETSVTDNLFDKGLDSLRLMELIAEIEDVYNIEFPFDDLNNDSLSTIENIEKTISKLIK